MTSWALCFSNCVHSPRTSVRQIHYLSYSWMYVSKWKYSDMLLASRHHTHIPSRSQIRPGGHSEKTIKDTILKKKCRHLWFNVSHQSPWWCLLQKGSSKRLLRGDFITKRFRTRTFLHPTPNWQRERWDVRTKSGSGKRRRKECAQDIDLKALAIPLWQMLAKVTGTCLRWQALPQWTKLIKPNG